jgi:hypothetical protein
MLQLKVDMGKMKEMEKEFRVMDWPGNFTDLSTIENCWGM